MCTSVFISENSTDFVILILWILSDFNGFDFYGFFVMDSVYFVIFCSGKDKECL